MKIIPFFSVIITVFNREHTILRAINSLMMQTCSDWEAIIINDGSTDESENVINNHIKNNKNFKYFYQENRGVGLAKSFGIEKCSGKYITFLDSDDEYKPEHLEIRKKYLLENTKFDVLHGGIEIIGNPFVPNFYNKNNLIHLDECCIGGTFFIKQDSFIKTNGYSELKFGDDIEFYNKVVENHLNIKKIEYNTYIYHRDNNDSLCNNI